MQTDDIVEIQQLIALYSHAVDMPDQSLFPLVFSEDGIFDGRPCGAELYEGREAISGYFALGKPPHPLAHHMTNCWVYEENGEIKVKSKCIFRHPLDGTICFGDYNDEVVRTASGWRIRRRTASPRDPAIPPDALEQIVGGSR
jgi:hypothetical protein